MSDLSGHLENRLRALKLKGIISRCRDLSEQAAQSSLSYEEYLSLLLEEKIERKTEGTVRTKIAKARFPFTKTLEEFDFAFQPSLNQKEMIRLGSLEFIENKENVLFLARLNGDDTPPALAVFKCRLQDLALLLTTWYNHGEKPPVSALARPPGFVFLARLLVQEFVQRRYGDQPFLANPDGADFPCL